jgi:hypothetical protein
MGPEGGMSSLVECPWVWICDWPQTALYFPYFSFPQ